MAHATDSARSPATDVPAVRREASLAVVDGSRVAVRIAATAVDPVTGRSWSWSEARLMRVSDGGVADVAVEVPVERIQAMREERPLLWAAPSDRASTRLGARVVRSAARRGGPAAATPVDVVSRYVEQFKNGRQFSVFPRLFAPGFRHHFDFPRRGDGFDSFMSVGRDLLASFHDLHVTVDDLFADGELVVESNTVRAVHRKAFAGVAATGRSVTWTEIHFYRVVDGRIVENWPNVNMERLVRSLL